jgi:hypothetical protein
LLESCNDSVKKLLGGGCEHNVVHVEQ